jgi:hypothetical protein
MLQPDLQLRPVRPYRVSESPTWGRLALGFGAVTGMGDWIAQARPSGYPGKWPDGI